MSRTQERGLGSDRARIPRRSVFDCRDRSSFRHFTSCDPEARQARRMDQKPRRQGARGGYSQAGYKRGYRRSRAARDDRGRCRPCRSSRPRASDFDWPRSTARQGALRRTRRGDGEPRRNRGGDRSREARRGQRQASGYDASSRGASEPLRRHREPVGRVEDASRPRAAGIRSRRRSPDGKLHDFRSADEQ